MHIVRGTIAGNGVLMPRQGLSATRRDFPAWHFPMVNDTARNAAIEAAIARLNLDGATVVEIGSGTGLIALLFAKYGAKRVITCEMNASLASMAGRIVASTAFADRVKIINDSSSNAIRHGLLPREPDVIFSETIDCGVIGEGFFSVAQDIEALAGPDTVVLPATILQSFSLVQSEDIANLNRAGNSCGFDLSALNEFSTASYFPVRSELFQHALLSQPVPYRSYDYIDCPEPEIRKVRVLRSGTIHGVLSWFCADFGGAEVSNAPFTGSHWHQAFHPLTNEIPVQEDDEVSVFIDDEGFASAYREHVSSQRSLDYFHSSVATTG